MKVLVTGAYGFMGRHLVEALENIDDFEVFKVGRDDEHNLESKLLQVDFIFHLAGVNRPKKIAEFAHGNINSIKVITDFLIAKNRSIPIVLSSSTQATLESAYGKSKKAGEDVLLEYARLTQADVFIFRLPNVFGEGGRPHYNSVVATFCYRISHSLEIEISDVNNQLNLVYVKDVVSAFMACLNRKKHNKDSFYNITEVYQVALGELAQLIQFFAGLVSGHPPLNKGFVTKMKSTYQSYVSY